MATTSTNGNGKQEASLCTIMQQINNNNKQINEKLSQNFKNLHNHLKTQKQNEQEHHGSQQSSQLNNDNFNRPHSNFKSNNFVARNNNNQYRQSRNNSGFSGKYTGYFNNRSQQFNVKKCYKCGSNKHLQANCPKVRNEFKNRNNTKNRLN